MVSIRMLRGVIQKQKDLQRMLVDFSQKHQQRLKPLLVNIMLKMQMHYLLLVMVHLRQLDPMHWKYYLMDL
jgi:hypothetical protein